MKIFLKSIGMCLGVLILNQIIVGFVSFIGALIIKSPIKINEYLYVLVFIGDLATLVLIHFIYSVYDKKLLSKEVFNKLDFKTIINIVLFGVGLSVILLMLVGILIRLIPSYIDVENQLQILNSSILQSLMAVVLIPICEELVFRRVIFGYLRKNLNIVLAVILQALIFGIAHGNIVQGIYTFILGIALALIYIDCNSLWGPITLHITFNFMGLFVVSKLASVSPIFEYVLLIVGVVCLVLSLLKLFKKYENELYEQYK